MCKQGRKALLLAGLLLPLSSGALLAQQYYQDPYQGAQAQVAAPAADVGILSALLRAQVARAQAGAVWRRFAPERRALVSEGSPWLAGGGRGARISPVSGQGAGGSGWSLWLEGAPQHMRNTSTALRGKGYALGQTLGLDRRLGERTTVGLNLGFTHTSVKTSYNSGREKNDAWLLGLYMSHQLAPWLSLDVQGGYVHQRQKLRRVFAGTAFSGRRSSNGYQLSGALNAWRWVGRQVMVSGRLGLIATRDHWKGYTESGGGLSMARPARTQALVQGVAEAGVSLWLEPVMPYARVGYTRDLYRKNMQASSSDRDDFTLFGGLQWFGSGAADGLSLDLGGSVVLGRAHRRHVAGSLGVRWAW